METTLSHQYYHLVKDVLAYAETLGISERIKPKAQPTLQKKVEPVAHVKLEVKAPLPPPSEEAKQITPSLSIEKPLIDDSLSKKEVAFTPKVPGVSERSFSEGIDCKEIISLIKKVHPNIVFSDTPLVEEALSVAILIYKDEEKPLLESLQKALLKENVFCHLEKIQDFNPESKTRLIIATKEGILETRSLHAIAKRDATTQILYFGKTPSLIIPDFKVLLEVKETRKAFWERLLEVLKRC